MFSKTDKRRLYELMDMYLSGKIDANSFCDEYYYCYDLEVDMDTLTELENKAFSDLGKVSSRFSPYKEDYALDIRAFNNEEQLRQKIIETNIALKKNE